MLQQCANFASMHQRCIDIRLVHRCTNVASMHQCYNMLPNLLINNNVVVYFFIQWTSGQQNDGANKRTNKRTNKQTNPLFICNDPMRFTSSHFLYPMKMPHERNLQLVHKIVRSCHVKASLSGLQPHSSDLLGLKTRALQIRRPSPDHWSLQMADPLSISFILVSYCNHQLIRHAVIARHLKIWLICGKFAVGKTQPCLKIHTLLGAHIEHTDTIQRRCNLLIWSLNSAVRTWRTVKSISFPLRPNRSVCSIIVSNSSSSSSSSSSNNNSRNGREQR